MANDELSADYLKRNYIASADRLEDRSSDEEVIRGFSNWEGEIKTVPYAVKSRRMASSPSEQSKLRVVESRSAYEGVVKREKSTRLHERIVALLAKRFGSGGYEVEEDPNSVDLFVAKGGHRAILEVKTVTPRNLLPRMRLGVGQLSEYRYRYQVHSGVRPLAVLVLSSEVRPPAIVEDLFRQDVRMGLVGLSEGERFVAHTSGSVEEYLAKTLTH